MEYDYNIYTVPELSYEDLASLLNNRGLTKTKDRTTYYDREVSPRSYPIGSPEWFLYQGWLDTLPRHWYVRCSESVTYTSFNSCDWPIPPGEKFETFWWRASKCNDPCKRVKRTWLSTEEAPFGLRVWCCLCEDVRNILLANLSLEELQVLFSQIFSQGVILDAIEGFISYSKYSKYVKFKGIWDNLLSEQQREYIFSHIEPENRKILLEQFDSSEKKKYFEILSTEQQVRYFVYDLAEQTDILDPPSYRRISFWRLLSDATRQKISEKLEFHSGGEIFEYGIEMYLCSKWVELKYRDTSVYKVCIPSYLFTEVGQRMLAMYSSRSESYKYNLVDSSSGKLISEKWFDEDVDIRNYNSTGNIENIKIDGKCYCWDESKGFYPAEFKYGEAWCANCKYFRWRKDMYHYGVYGYCVKKEENTYKTSCCMDFSPAPKA